MFDYYAVADFALSPVSRYRTGQDIAEADVAAAIARFPRAVSKRLAEPKPVAPAPTPEPDAKADPADAAAKA